MLWKSFQLRANKQDSSGTSDEIDSDSEALFAPA